MTLEHIYEGLFNFCIEIFLVEMPPILGLYPTLVLARTGKQFVNG
jgi:hypothetical protein